MKLDPAEHARRPLRARELAAAEGLALHDVWQLDADLPPGFGLAELERALRGRRPPRSVAALLALRSALGRATGIDRGSKGIVPVVDTPGERVYRIENRTVTALAQLAIVERRARVGVYVRPHGRGGRAYPLAIEPFRRFVVYPGLLRWAENSLRAQ